MSEIMDTQILLSDWSITESRVSEMGGVGEFDFHCANRVLIPTSGGVFLCVGLESHMDNDPQCCSYPTACATDGKSIAHA